MGIFKPTEECLVSSTNSVYISAPLVRLIEKQSYEFDPHELAEEMKSLRAEVDSESEARFKAKREQIMQHAPAELKLAVKAASEKGESSWVTATPSYDHGTVLHKRDFVDACYIRYGWTLLNLPAGQRSACSMRSTASSEACASCSTTKCATQSRSACVRQATQQ